MSSSPPPSGATASAAGVRPWRHFADPSFLSIPISLSESSYRLSQNLRFFLPNYAFITLGIFLLTLITRPLQLILFLCVFAAWIYLLFLRDEPLSLLEYDIDPKIIVGFLLVLTLGALFWTNAWLSIFLALTISAVIILLHGVLRAPEDSEDSPYGSLLNVVDSPRGQYSIV